MRLVRAVLVSASMVAALVAAPAAQAAEGQAFSAGLNYATPVVTIGKGDALRLTNLDNLAGHDLDAEDGSFQSDTVGFGQSTPVKGVEKLNPGSYAFHCTLHAWMTGVLQVVPASTGGGGGEAGGGLTSLGAGPGLGSAAPDPIDLAPQAPPAPLGKGDWPLYGHDLDNSRNGGTAGPTAAEVPTLGPAWSFFSSRGDFTGTPVVADNLLVAGTGQGWVYALNATTGRVRWARKASGSINGTAAIAGGRVYVPVATPHKPSVAAYDAKTGDLVWEAVVDTQKNADVFGSPVVWRDTVYMGVSAEYGETSDPNVNVRGSVVALDAGSGRQRWKTYTVPEHHDGGSVWTTPAIDTQTGRLYVGTGNAYHEPAAATTDSMIAFDARTGRMLEHFQATANDVWNGTEKMFGAGPDYDFGASPNLMLGPGGRRLVGEGQKSGTYWALDRATMKPAWSGTTAPPGIFLGGIVGSTAWDGLRVYGPDTVGEELWSLDPAGHSAWFSSDAGPLGFNATTVANGVVYSTSMSGYLTAREATTGAVLAKLPLGSPSWAGVSVAGGSVFTATGTQGGSGYLVAYRPRTELNVKPGYANEGYDPRGEAVDKAECTPSERTVSSRTVRAKSKKKQARKTHAKKRKTARRAGEKHVTVVRTPCTKRPDSIYEPEDRDEPHNDAEGHTHGGPPAGGFLLKASRRRGDRFVPEPAGTTKRYAWYFGPYTVPPGQDLNRVDLEIPAQNGFMLSAEPTMRKVADGSKPGHMEGHIHHAHWFAADPGNPEDNYTGGNTEWIFGNGDEETRGDFQERSAADPTGPVYGQYIKAGDPQLMIYMLHNKTAAPMEVYIVLDVTFAHGTPEELKKATGREYHDVSGVLFGRTYDVPRNPNGDGTHQYARDSGKVVEWTSTLDGTIIGMGGHLHPGGISVRAENYGPANSPCPDDGKGYGGTTLFLSRAIPRRAPLSEDFQMEVTNPGFRAPIHKGDRLRISATYENRDHAWYRVMEHMGMYVDTRQPPQGRCTAKVVGVSDKPSEKVTRTTEKRRVRTCTKRRCTWRTVRQRVRRKVVTLPIDPTKGVSNREWRFHPDPLCGSVWGVACELPEKGQPSPVPTNVVTITNFTYTPGSRTAGSSDPGQIAVVPRGQSITFVNADQGAGIRHSVTTCPWPCNGPYVGNYPLADGRWDSGTMGYDPVDGGSPNPTSSTPADLPPGRYAYFCRIHSWMRGAFEVK